ARASPVPFLDALRRRLADELAGDAAGVWLHPTPAHAIFCAPRGACLVRWRATKADSAQRTDRAGLHGKPLGTAPMVCGRAPEPGRLSNELCRRGRPGAWCCGQRLAP